MPARRHPDELTDRFADRFTDRLIGRFAGLFTVKRRSALTSARHNAATVVLPPSALNSPRWALAAALAGGMVASMLAVPAPAWAQVYRCGNSYSEEPCKGGKQVDTSPTLADPSGPKTVEIYLCRAPEGARYWVPERCALRGWTMERSERVPRNVPWEDQVAAARHKMAVAEGRSADRSPAAIWQSQAAAAQQANQQRQRHYQAQMKAQNCQAMEARIAELDRQGREGSRKYDLDRVRAERKDVRDAHYRSGC